MTGFTRSLSIAGVATCTAVAGAQTFNYADDFSITNGNPNGAWAYGYMNSLGGPMTAHATAITFNDLEYWYSDFGLIVPSAFKNIGVGTTFGLLPGEAALHGGNDPGQYGVARFSSLGLVGTVTINGSFGIGDAGNVDVHILKNGVALFTELGTFDAQSFSITTSLAAGDTIDFLVGRSTIINYDTTPLDATLVVTAPNPGTIAVFGSGAAALLRRRRR
ncbi:MAG: hypothetical protein AABZ53_11040 [Planctomycetota bacterium]